MQKMSHFTTTFIGMPEARMDALEAKMEKIENLISQRNDEDSLNRWLESEDARKMLGVSPRTWQSMRDNRIIPFSQFGRKILVKRSDIEDFLNKNLVKERGQ